MVSQAKSEHRIQLDKARRNLQRCKGIPPTVKLVAHHYLEGSYGNFKVSFYKQSTIAAEIGYSTRTIERATRALFQVNAFTVVARSDVEARAQGIKVKSNHRYHNYLRPNLDWAGFTQDTLPPEQIELIKVLMSSNPRVPVGDQTRVYAGHVAASEDVDSTASGSCEPQVKPDTNGGLKPDTNGGLKPDTSGGPNRRVPSKKVPSRKEIEFYPMDKNSISRGENESESSNPQDQEGDGTHHLLVQASQDNRFNDFIDLFQQYRIHATLDRDYTYTDAQICRLYSAWLEHPHFHNKYRDVIDQTLASKYLREAAEKGTFKLNPVVLFTNRQGTYGTTGPVWKLILERKLYYPFDAQTLSYRVRQLRYNVVTPEGIRPATLDDMCRDGHIKEQEEWFAKIVLERLERRSKDPSILGK